MNTILYSKTTNAFYDTSLIYKSIPDDSVDIGYDAHSKLLSGMGPNDVWLCGPDGKPIIQRRPVTLEQEKSAQVAAITSAYEKAIQQPISFTSLAGITKTYQADPGSVSNLQNMLLAYQSTKTAPEGFYWVAADNTQVPFTYADMEGLATAMGNQGLAAFQNLQTKKAAINAATTVAEVQAVGW